MSYVFNLGIPAAGSPMRPRIVRRRAGMYGLGMTVHGVTLQDCSQYGADVAAGYECAQRNQAAIEASYGEIPVSAAPAGYTIPSASQYAGGSYSGSYLGPNYQAPPAPAISSASSAPPASSPTYTPSVSFVNSRGGSTLYPGDTWTITLTGAPNADVFVTGGKNGAQDKMRMGSTDGSGRFSLTGKIASDQIGLWSEVWTVGGQSAGSFSFTVVAGPGGSASGSSSTGGNTSSGSPASSGVTPPGTITTVSSSFAFLSEIPWWAWIAGGGLALYAFSGRGHGR